MLEHIEIYGEDIDGNRGQARHHYILDEEDAVTIRECLICLLDANGELQEHEEVFLYSELRDEVIEITVNTFDFISRIDYLNYLKELEDEQPS
jgi:hypothetical protein